MQYQVDAHAFRVSSRHARPHVCAWAVKVCVAAVAATAARLAGGKLLGQGVSDEEWRQQVAIGRKRSRASGEDQPAPAAAAAPPATTQDTPTLGDQAPIEPSSQSPMPRPSTLTEPAPAAADSDSRPPADAEDCAGSQDNVTGQSGAAAAAAATDAAPAVPGAGEGECGIKGRRGAVGEGAVRRRKQGAARAREVQELLDSVGGSAGRGGRGGTVVIGDRRGCDGLTEDVREEIRRNLDTAAKAEKAAKVEVRCRYTGGGVPTHDGCVQLRCGSLWTGVCVSWMQCFVAVLRHWHLPCGATVRAW